MNKRSLLPALLLSCLRAQFAPHQTALEHVRAVNLERAAKLPDFVADETAVRYHSRHTDPPEWKHVDTIESEIAFQRGTQFSRQHVRVNGQPWHKKGFNGYNWGGPLG